MAAPKTDPLKKGRKGMQILDQDTTLVRGKNIFPIIALTIAAVLGYARFEQRMTVVETQQLQLTHSIDKLTEQIGRVFVDGVATRQAQTWIEMARALNREKNGSVVWPDLPR